MTTQNDLKILADGMRALSQRLKSSRPAADVPHIASGLSHDATALLGRLVSERQIGPQAKDVIESIILVHPVELNPANNLRRASRILRELATGKFADDAAKELDGVADELISTQPAAGDPQKATPDEVKARLELMLENTVFLHAMREVTAYSAMPGMTEEIKETRDRYNFSFSAIARLLEAEWEKKVDRRQVIAQAKKIEHRGYTLHQWISGKGKSEALR